MKPVFTIRHAAALLPLIAAPLSAFAADPAANAADPAAGTNYVGLHLGQNNVTRLNARIDFGAGEPLPGEARAVRGLHGGLVLGRRTEHARFELEYEAGRFGVEHVTLGPQSADVDARGEYQAVFANAYRTERVSESLDAFVGAGVGLGRVRLPRIGLGETCACFGPASKSGTALQLRTGLEYRVSDASSIGLQYSWLRLPALEAGGPPAVRYDRKTVGAWSLSWTHRF